MLRKLSLIQPERFMRRFKREYLILTMKPMELNWVLNICLAMLTLHQEVPVPAKEEPAAKKKRL
jgi:hypothetical protein